MRSFLTSPFPKQTIITTDVIQLLADCEKEVIFHDRLIKEQQQWYRESSKQKRTTKTSYMHVAAWYHGTPPPPDQSSPNFGNRCRLARPLNVPYFIALQQKVCQMSSFKNLDPHREGTGVLCHWQTCIALFITADVLQTKVDAQCDKLATELSWKLLRLWMFSSYGKLFVQSRQF